MPGNNQITPMKTTVFLRAVVSITLLSASSVALAANALLDFSDTLKSFRANFTQTVYDADSVVLQESSGIVVLARPGRFKWTYDAPVNQVIIADGLTLWVYDEEIKQVTRQPQSTTLGSAPIGLLSGQRDIESEFVITELGIKDDLEWFQLQPLVSDTDFNEIFIALNGGGLHAMELRDNFDQATQIVFSGFEKNMALDTDQFLFVVPDGVDVVGEGGIAENPDDLLDDQENPNQQAANPESDPSTDPLLADDTDPLLDDISTTELQDTPEQVDSAVSSSNAPQPNSDEDLLNGELPVADPPAANDSTDDQIATTPGDSSIESATTEEMSQPTLIDPKREITFEERKVTQ